MMERATEKARHTPDPERFRPLLIAVAVAVAVTVLFGCGGSEPQTRMVGAGLPRYTPEFAAIFGDALSPVIVGLPSDDPPGDDPKLRRRIAEADSIAVVRVATVSEAELRDSTVYDLSLDVQGHRGRGKPPESPLELQIGRESPSFRQVEALGPRLIGRGFLLFVKTFEEAGQIRIHWYGEADFPKVEEAISSTKPLDSVKPGVQTPR